MKKRKLFQTTAVLHPDGALEICGGAMRHVRAEAAKTRGARAIVLRETSREEKRLKTALRNVLEWLACEEPEEAAAVAQAALEIEP